MSEDLIKDVLKRMPYLFCSITSRNGDEVNAMVANWVMQASFTPRMVALGLAKNSHTRQVVESGKVFAINLFLKADQELIMPFTKSRAKNPDKMKEVVYTSAPITGCPILEGAAAYCECDVKQMVDAGGDHFVVIAEVVGAGVLKEGEVTDTLTLPDLGWSYAG